jgi:hypothetical protein
MSLGQLTSGLAAAQYKSHLCDVRLPPDLFSLLSSEARAFIRILTETYDAGDYSVYQFLLDEWTDADRTRFEALGPDTQLEVLGFVTGLLHEYTHHVDLLTTPTGANFQSKMLREYLAFQRHWPTLVNAEPPLLDADTTLADWLARHPAGPDSARDLMARGSLGVAEVELRGPAAFEDMMRGVPPRRVTTGWPGEEKHSVTLRGRQYEKLVVNQVWATIDPAAAGVRYLGLREILEGRALALSLFYIFHLLGDRLAGDQQVILRYVRHFYRNSAQYKVATATVAGKDLDELCASPGPSLLVAIQETFVAAWYALHSPPPVVGDDVLMASPSRFLMACRALQENDICGFSSVSSFFNALDRELSHRLSYKPARELLDQTIDTLESVVGYADECTNPIMRAWFRTVISTIIDVHRARLESGYELSSGMPWNGNVLTGIDASIGDALTRIDSPPTEVTKWFTLRSAVLYTRGGAKGLKQLEDWFG